MQSNIVQQTLYRKLIPVFYKSMLEGPPHDSSMHYPRTRRAATWPGGWPSDHSADITGPYCTVPTYVLYSNWRTVLLKSCGRTMRTSLCGRRRDHEADVRECSRLLRRAYGKRSPPAPSSMACPSPSAPARPPATALSPLLHAIHHTPDHHITSHHNTTQHNTTRAINWLVCTVVFV